MVMKMPSTASAKGSEQIEDASYSFHEKSLQAWLMRSYSHDGWKH